MKELHGTKQPWCNVFLIDENGYPDQEANMIYADMDEFLDNERDDEIEEDD